MICIFMMTGKGLVSKDAASCVPGVKCFFIHYSLPTVIDGPHHPLPRSTPSIERTPTPKIRGTDTMQVPSQPQFTHSNYISLSTANETYDAEHQIPHQPLTHSSTQPTFNPTKDTIFTRPFFLLKTNVKLFSNPREKEGSHKTTSTP